MSQPPRETSESQRIVTRRGLVLGGGMTAFMGLLTWRMRQLQVEEADQYRLLADENRINIHLIPPSRGRIFDREGRVIAENVPSYRITMVREQVSEDIETVLARLGEIVELTPVELERAREDLLNLRGDSLVTLADRESWEDICRVSGITPAKSAAAPPWLIPHVLRLPTPLFRRIAAQMLTIDATARSSMWEDLTRRRPTEIDALQGVILDLAQRQGRQAPLNTRMRHLIKQAEAAEEGPPGLSPADIAPRF